MPPAALMSLAARSSPSFACRPYSSTPPENGNTAPILIGSAEFAHGELAIAAQQVSQTNEMLFGQRTFITGIPSPRSRAAWRAQGRHPTRQRTAVKWRLPVSRQRRLNRDEIESRTGT